MLHPNQFTITNPASPGGTHGKRATRLRREAEEIQGFPENKKRRRNGNEDDGSPAPQRRALDANSITPYWQHDRIQFGKTTGPIYSIDKLFTDKELSLAYNNAALAAHKYMLRHKGKGGVAWSASDSGLDEHDDGEEIANSAPSMERTTSQPATRSTRGHNSNFVDNKVLGIEALANLDLPGNLERFDAQEPKLPPIVPAPYNKVKPMTDSSGPAPLAAEDAAKDWRAIGILLQYEHDHGVGSNLDEPHGVSKSLLEAVIAKPEYPQYVAFVQGERPDHNGLAAQLGVEESNIRGEPPSALRTYKINPRT